MVDREAKRAEGKGVGYDRWAAKYNLKQMAATVTAYQQYGFSSPEELDEACSAAYAAMRESLTELKQVEKTLNGKKELQRHHTWQFLGHLSGRILLCAESLLRFA